MSSCIWHCPGERCQVIWSERRGDLCAWLLMEQEGQPHGCWQGHPSWLVQPPLASPAAQSIPSQPLHTEPTPSTSSRGIFSLEKCHKIVEQRFLELGPMSQFTLQASLVTLPCLVRHWVLLALLHKHQAPTAVPSATFPSSYMVSSFRSSSKYPWQPLTSQATERDILPCPSGGCTRTQCLFALLRSGGMFVLSAHALVPVGPQSSHQSTTTLTNPFIIYCNEMIFAPAGKGKHPQPITELLQGKAGTSMTGKTVTLHDNTASKLGSRRAAMESLGLAAVHSHPQECVFSSINFTPH